MSSSALPGSDLPTGIAPDSIVVIGQMMGFDALSEDVAHILAQDVEYRIRQITLEASKFSKHAHRQRLSTRDVGHAMELLNVEPIFGFSNGLNSEFIRIGSDLFHLVDEQLSTRIVLSEQTTSIPSRPLVPSMRMHWLAIDGVQPLIPENPIPDEFKRRLSRKRSAEESGRSVQTDEQKNIDTDDDALVLPPLSSELVEYFETIIHTISSFSGVLQQEDDSPSTSNIVSLKSSVYGGTDVVPGLSAPRVVSKADVLRFSLGAVSSDPGLQPLTSSFVDFVVDRVNRFISNGRMVSACLGLVTALCLNKHVSLESHVSRLIPSILSCACSPSVGDRRALHGERISEGNQRVQTIHWRVREQAAELVGRLFRRFRDSVHLLENRITATIVDRVMSPDVPASSRFGGLLVACYMGPDIVQSLLLEPIGDSNFAFLWQLIQDIVSENEPETEEYLGASYCQNALFRCVEVYVTGETNMKLSTNDQQKVLVDSSILSDTGDGIREKRHEKARNLVEEAIRRQSSTHARRRRVLEHLQDLQDILGPTMLPLTLSSNPALSSELSGVFL